VPRRPEGDRAAKLGIAGALAVAAAVSLDVAVGGPLTSLDQWVYAWARATGLPSTGWRDPLHGLGSALNVATGLGTRELVPVLGLLIALLGRHRRTARPLVRFAVLTVLVVLTVQMLKVGFGRLPPPGRPAGEGGRSYPSGHTVTAVAYWALLAWTVVELRYPASVRRAAITMAFVGPLLTMAAMVALTYHWLTDVVGGAAIGVLLLGALRVVDSVALTHWRGAGDRVSVVERPESAGVLDRRRRPNAVAAEGDRPGSAGVRGRRPGPNAVAAEGDRTAPDRPAADGSAGHASAADRSAGHGSAADRSAGHCSAGHGSPDHGLGEHGSGEHGSSRQGSARHDPAGSAARAGRDVRARTDADLPASGRRLDG
jgi:membrane-associated phospholipid phosphatase